MYLKGLLTPFTQKLHFLKMHFSCLKNQIILEIEFRYKLFFRTWMIKVAENWAAFLDRPHLHNNANTLHCKLLLTHFARLISS